MDLTAEARERRIEAASAFEVSLGDLDELARRLADVFHAGGWLRPVGHQLAAIDASHVAVEFLHPVVAGKRALPALPLEAGETAAPGDLVLSLTSSFCEAAAPSPARSPGVMTAVLGPRADADIAVAIDGIDRWSARELQVTGYHLLWEAVHEHLGARASESPSDDDLATLYPSIYGGDGDRHDGRPALVAKLAASTQVRDRLLRSDAATVVEIARAIHTAAERGNRVWTFGNGGSSTDAAALAWLLRHESDHAIAATSLATETATLTALANDIGVDVVFTRQLRALGRPGDVAIGLSTSGGSTNVLDALDAAGRLGMTSVGLAGYGGGAMADLDGLDHLVAVDSSSVHRIQEAQTTALHVLVEAAVAGAPVHPRAAPS